jgi:hypothetical protein
MFETHQINTNTLRTSTFWTIFIITMRHPSSSHPTLLQSDCVHHSSKRQRRELATIVVQRSARWSQSTMLLMALEPKKKSKAQPRPILHVPPRGIDGIFDPNTNDVLCGRGGRVNSHVGNIHFREIISHSKVQYQAETTKKLEKAYIASRIINCVRSMDPPGRFLKEDADTGLWYDIGDAKAIKKAGQALREDAGDSS